MNEPKVPLRTISLEELNSKLTSGAPFRLIMALNDWAYKAKHIPKSENYGTLQELEAAVRPDEDVVVYCTNEACHASVALYHELLEDGYRSVARYSGGINEWEEQGMPLEGEWITRSE